MLPVSRFQNAKAKDRRTERPNASQHISQHWQQGHQAGALYWNQSERRRAIEDKTQRRATTPQRCGLQGRTKGNKRNKLQTHTNSQNSAGAAETQSSSEASATEAQPLRDKQSRRRSLQVLEQAHRKRGANPTPLPRRQQTPGPVRSSFSRCLAQRKAQHQDERRCGIGLGKR